MGGLTAHGHAVPAWLRPTRGEHRWPAAVAVLAAVVLQVLLPERMVPGSRFLLPGLELGLLAVLVALDPHRMVAERQGLRVAGLTLTALVSLANA